MHFTRSTSRLTILLVGSLVMAGCDRQSKPSVVSDAAPHSDPQATRPASTEVASSGATNHLVAARRLLLVHDFDGAAAAAYRALLQDPENSDATLIAAKAEAGRGNHKDAAALAGSIEVESRLGRSAVELHYQQLVAMKEFSAAADVILAAQEVIESVPEWNHRAWELLNRAGRREEASQQADVLCLAGQATEPELHSLVRRTRSFPFNLAEGKEPEAFFEPGLGMARWYFSQAEYATALNELSAQSRQGFESAAACALYGRLLAEMQKFEEISSWHAQCDDRVRALGDYWAALGVFFYDQRQYEASARALLESVHRNPTDRLSLQRLSKVFHSLKRPEDGQLFRERGINVADTERLSDAILEAEQGGDTEMRLSLAKELAALGRPFEMLAWTTSLAEPSSLEWSKMDRQRQELASSKRARAMAAEMSLLEIPLDDFQLENAMHLLQAPDPAVANTVQSTEILARPRLLNVASRVGIDFQWYRDIEFDPSIIPIHESVGGGIAVIDYDLDGWPDAYFGQGSGEPPTDQCTRSNVLVRNLNGQFTETTASAEAQDYNFSSGIACGDVNQDGFPDLWLGSLGHNRLLINNGDGTFADVTERLGTFDDRFTSSLAIADINGDTLPDLFETNYIQMDGAFALPKMKADGKPEMPGPLSHYSAPDRWWESDGEGGFRMHEISRQTALPSTSLGIVVTDFDSDGDNEVFVGNDLRANHLFVHTGDNTLVNVADTKGVANGYQGLPNGCMGISAADFNRDGSIDLHITNFNNESSNLYLQTDGGLFSDVAVRFGIDQATDPMVGFGTKSVDIDRNGWLDLIVTNGHIFDTRIFGEPLFKMPPQVLMSRGDRFEASKVDDESGYWDGAYLGRSMASLDFDRNGTIDFLIGHLDQPLALLDNRTTSRGSWIQIELVGTQSERDAIGARVEVTAGEQQWTQWVTGGDGYFCSDQPLLDFGLGSSDVVQRVQVHWPAGDSQTFEGLRAGHRYLIVQGDPLPTLQLDGQKENARFVD